MLSQVAALSTVNITGIPGHITGYRHTWYPRSLAALSSSNEYQVFQDQVAPMNASGIPGPFM
jgi:hypothetical protein